MPLDKQRQVAHMHSHTPQYEVFWVPDDLDLDEAILLGLRWLIKQPGEPLILLHTRSMIDNNRLLGTAAAEYRIRYEAPATVWRSTRGHWGGGAILAPWASPDVLQCVDDHLSHNAHGVCVIGWRPGGHDGWISARRAVNLADGKPLGTPVGEIISDPVVRIALDHAERFVNHNNALVQAGDKSYLVRTLQELHRGGHRLDLDEICAYAMATGWTGQEVKRIREYGEQILAGRSFRLRATIGPKRGSCQHWEKEARGDAA